MEMDINALSRPYDPEMDDEMPVQGFLQGGEVGGGGGGGGYYKTIDDSQNGGSVYQVWVPDATAGGGGTTAGGGNAAGGGGTAPNLVGGTGGRTDPEKYFDPAEVTRRQEESDKYFQNSSNNRLSNSAYINNTQSSYNPYVATMPIDPATGLPKSPQSYTVYETLAPGQVSPTGIDQKATSQRMLADYTKAVSAIPMGFAFDPNAPRSYNAPQMPTTADFIARRDKASAGVPIMGQYTDPNMYSREANPNYMPFKSDPYARRITTMPIENSNNGGGTFDMQVVVYGPDGKVYGSPAEARAAGVTNYTSTPPGSTVMGSKAILKVGGYVNGGMVQHFADGGGVEGTQPVRRSQVPEQFQNATYDDASRKAALDRLREFNQSVNGVTDAEIAAQIYGLDQAIARDPNYVEDRKKPIPITYLSKYNDATRADAQAALSAKGLNAAGLSDLELAQATHAAYPEGYATVDSKTGQYKSTWGGGTTTTSPITTTTPPTTTTNPITTTTPPTTTTNPIIGSRDIAPVVGTKPPGTTGTGVSVAPGTNIPFQPLPGSGQTAPVTTDLTKFNTAYESNKNLNPGIGQLPPGFSFDPNKYFSPSQAQTKIAANPNLTPTALGSYTQNTDRLGNVIATPTIDPLKFQSFYTPPVTRAAGGLVEDDEDTEASGAKQMLKGYEQLTGPRETRVVSSPNRQSVRTRQASQIVDQQGRPAGMSMNTSSMTTAQGPSQASPEQLATAKAMLSDLMRQNLSKRRFADGGEASNFPVGHLPKRVPRTKN